MEMSNALKTIGNLPKNILIKNPAGTFSFVGRIDIRLCYTEHDGSPLTKETAGLIRQFGCGFVRPRPRVRTWLTEEDAMKALAELPNTWE